MAVIKKYPYTFNNVLDTQYPYNPVYQNLLINGVPDVLIYENSTLVTRETVKNVPRIDFFSYIDSYYNDTFISKASTPYLICFCDGNFSNLDNILYDPIIVDYLNNRGLHIYLWEMLVYKTENTKTSEWIITTDDHDDLEEIFMSNKDTIVGFENSESILKTLKAFEFEKISNFVSKNKLTNVTVFTGNYQNNKYFQSAYPNITIKVKDVAIASMFNESTNALTSYTYIKDLKLPSSDTIEHKFCSWNKRYAAHRNIIAAYLLDRNAIISYNADQTDFFRKHIHFDITDKKFYFWKDISKKMWFDLRQWKDKYPNTVKKLYPNLKHLEKVRYISVDKDIKNLWMMYEQDALPVEHYQRSFCTVVTETVFAQPCGHFADKTLNAIKCFRPFVLAAPPHSLEYLKSFGVKTFSDYWDETYDQEENHEQRLLKILEVIDYIDSKSIEELREIYNDMKQILEHNYKIIQNLKYQE